MKGEKPWTGGFNFKNEKYINPGEECSSRQLLTMFTESKEMWVLRQIGTFRSDLRETLNINSLLNKM